MSILDGATIEFETSNPVLSEFIGDINNDIDKVSIYNICDYLGIGDTNFGDTETIDKISKIIALTGKESALEKIQEIVSEIGFKPGVLDDIYCKLMLEKEIKRTAGNLENLLKQKYGDNSSIQK